MPVISQEKTTRGAGHWAVHSNAHFLTAKVRMAAVPFKPKNTKCNILGVNEEDSMIF